MGTRTFYNTHSEDQATYLEMMTLVDAERAAERTCDEAATYARDLDAMGWKRGRTAEAAQRRAAEVHVDHLEAVLAASHIRWSGLVGGWYYVCQCLEHVCHQGGSDE